MFVRYLLSHLLVGCVGGLVATAGLIATNVGSLGELMQHSEGGWLDAALLAVGLSGTFGSAAIGCAITQIGEDEVNIGGCCGPNARKRSRRANEPE